MTSTLGNGNVIQRFKGGKMNQSELAWNLLRGATGTFAGHGINHAGEKFTGKLSLKPVMSGKLLTLQATATGENGVVFHDENSWIGYDINGHLIYFVASNNHPGITPHFFSRIEETPESKKVVFRFGNPVDKESFREEITFSVFKDGSLAHNYAWGLPEGEFLDRSGSRMQKLKNN
jgi:hypothetical protein